MRFFFLEPSFGCRPLCCVIQRRKESGGGQVTHLSRRRLRAIRRPPPAMPCRAVRGASSPATPLQRFAAASGATPHRSKLKSHRIQLDGAHQPYTSPRSRYPAADPSPSQGAGPRRSAADGPSGRRLAATHPRGRLPFPQTSRAAWSLVTHTLACRAAREEGTVF